MTVPPFSPVYRADTPSGWPYPTRTVAAHHGLQVEQRLPDLITQRDRPAALGALDQVLHALVQRPQLPGLRPFVSPPHRLAPGVRLHGSPSQASPWLSDKFSSDKFPLSPGICANLSDTVVVRT